MKNKKFIIYCFVIAGLLFASIILNNISENFIINILISIFLIITLVFLLLSFKQIKGIDEKYYKVKALLTKQENLTKRKTRLAEYFNRVLKDAADIIFTLDIDGYVLKFNKGAEAILGFQQYEIVGTPFTNLLTNPSESVSIFDVILKEDAIQNREIKMKAKDGHVIDVSMSISEMKDERNQILGMVATCKDITKTKKLEQELLEKNIQLKELSITDNLSKLFNVRHFHSEATKAFTRLNRNLYESITLLLIDIDKFKQLNDTEGHQAGDNVIEVLGQIMSSSIRKDLDTAYRYGGDEFVILLLDTLAENAIVVANRIITTFKKEKFGETSLSIGITTAKTKDNEESLVKRADRAMYKAKRNGGNKYEII